MPNVIIAINNPKSFGLTTFLSIIIDGRDSAVTAIIKDRVVPMATPFSASALTRGITPAAFE
jgi:hypothetical protein